MSELGGNNRITLTVEEAATMLGIGRNQAYDAVRRHEVPSLRIGKRILIPRVALERLLSCETTQQGPAA